MELLDVSLLNLGLINVVLGASMWSLELIPIALQLLFVILLPVVGGVFFFLSRTIFE